MPTYKVNGDRHDSPISQMQTLRHAEAQLSLAWWPRLVLTPWLPFCLSCSHGTAMPPTLASFFAASWEVRGSCPLFCNPPAGLAPQASLPCPLFPRHPLAWASAALSCPAKVSGSTLASSPFPARRRAETGGSSLGQGGDSKAAPVGDCHPEPQPEADVSQAQILNTETGKLAKLNTPGELCIRGYCVMQGYWDEPQKTLEAVSQDKWYRTGDIASMDEQGFCRIVGRSKDMIIRGGENIYPAELEDFFHTHPQIQEVQVVGVKDHRMGEEICACIRLKSGQTVTEEEIKAFCKGKISHFKIPRYIVFVNDYPLTISGKIQKFKLREQMERRLNL